MASSFQKEREDRELFSELIESPVNPFLFHVQPPLINGLDPNFYVQICWETLWVWRGLTCDKVRLFDSFKGSLKMLGYDVKDECKTRVVPVLITRIHWMLRQTAKIKNGKRRRMTREEKWCTICSWQSWNFGVKARFVKALTCFHYKLVVSTPSEWSVFYTLYQKVIGSK